MKKQLPLFILIDPPSRFAPLAAWQSYLLELEALPANTLLLDVLLAEAREWIATRH